MVDSGCLQAVQEEICRQNANPGLDVSREKMDFGFVSSFRTNPDDFLVPEITHVWPAPVGIVRISTL